MKRFLIFLVVLGVAALGLYVWWQRNAAKVIEAEVKSRARDFVVDPNSVKVENDPVVMTSLNAARIGKLTISGTDLVLKSGPKLATVKIEVKDLEVNGPPFRFSKVAGGSFKVTVTDTAVSDYLQKKGIQVGGGIHIPTNTLFVRFQPKNQASLRGVATIPLVSKQVALIVNGELQAASSAGQVNFHPTSTNLPLGGKEVMAAVEKNLNPVVDVTEWPVQCKVTKISTGDGIVTLTGDIDGVRAPSLLP